VVGRVRRVAGSPTGDAGLSGWSRMAPRPLPWDLGVDARDRTGRGHPTRGEHHDVRELRSRPRPGRRRVRDLRSAFGRRRTGRGRTGRRRGRRRAIHTDGGRHVDRWPATLTGGGLGRHHPDHGRHPGHGHHVPGVGTAVRGRTARVGTPARVDAARVRDIVRGDVLRIHAPAWVAPARVAPAARVDAAGRDATSRAARLAGEPVAATAPVRAEQRIPGMGDRRPPRWSRPGHRHRRRPRLPGTDGGLAAQA
jgi:hypothetical protein